MPLYPVFHHGGSPLIPGSTLYYCMNAVVSSNLLAAEHYGEQTFLAAFGIAGGMAIAWCLADLSRKLHALLTGHNPAK
ncbi:threonine/serine exporter family protein [Faecalibacterium sp. OF04-11AC]|uniref:threonine/serine exporter family protein n=1 Tax=Faecalibacterium sp. OF04-11AC TaxID=2293109 RepID=UPI001FA8E619|nr:threonine/serine exporter family protein [Faecalibacterium sp. OF04-11AC]